jgi:PKD repeat protein
MKNILPKASLMRQLIAFALITMAYCQSCKKEDVAANRMEPLYITYYNSGYGAIEGMPLTFKVKDRWGDVAFDKDKFKWDFGDGETSKEHTPKHTYKVAGEYNVSLVINGYEKSAIIGVVVVFKTPGDATVAPLAGMKSWHGVETTINPNVSVGRYDTQIVSPSFEMIKVNNLTFVAKGDTFKLKYPLGTQYRYQNHMLTSHHGTPISYKYFDYNSSDGSIHYASYGDNFNAGGTITTNLYTP